MFLQLKAKIDFPRHRLAHFAISILYTHGVRYTYKKLIAKRSIVANLINISQILINQCCIFCF